MASPNGMKGFPKDGEIPSEGLTRRKALGFLAAAVVVGVAGKAEKALAQEVGAPVQLAAYTESQLGIDYAEIAESPLDAMLAAGEAEWMGNPDVKAEYGEDMAEVWKENAVLIAKEKITNQMYVELERLTPGLLSTFAGLPEQQFPLLYRIGVNAGLRKTLDEITKITG